MCRCGQIVNLKVKVEGLEPELRRVARLLYDGKLKPGQIDAGMVKKMASQMLKSFSQGYKDFDKADLLPFERTFVEQIKDNIVSFAGYKNHAELKEASELIIGENGALKDFSTFFQDLQKVDATYNEIYAQAEYNNLVASGQSAATWQSYVRNGIRVLTFITAGDNNVRAEHAAFDGLTLDRDDPFWETHMTPLDWGCRCDTQPGDEADILPIDDFIDQQREKGIMSADEQLPKIPALFQNNVGKTGKVFTQDHPYFDVNKKTAAAIDKQVAEIRKDI